MIYSCFEREQFHCFKEIPIDILRKTFDEYRYAWQQMDIPYFIHRVNFLGRNCCPLGVMNIVIDRNWSLGKRGRVASVGPTDYDAYYLPSYGREEVAVLRSLGLHLDDPCNNIAWSFSQFINVIDCNWPQLSFDDLAIMMGVV